MRHLFIVLFFAFTVAAQAQYKAINFNKTIIRYDTTVVNEIPESINGYSWNLLKLKTTGDTLAVFFEDGNVLLHCTPTSSNIAQVSTTTAIMITLPTTVSTNRYLINNQVAYEWTKTSHAIPDLFSDVDRKKVYRNSDGKNVCTLFGNGAIWREMPTNPTLIAQGIIKITLP